MIVHDDFFYMVSNATCMQGRPGSSTDYDKCWSVQCPMLCRGGLDQDHSRCVKCVMLFMSSLRIEGVDKYIPGLGIHQFNAGKAWI